MSIDISIFDDPVTLQREVPVSDILELLGTVEHWSHRLIDVLDHYYRHKLTNAIAFGNNDEQAAIELLDHIQHVINRYKYIIVLAQHSHSHYDVYWVGYIRILETWLGILDGKKYYEHNN